MANSSLVSLALIPFLLPGIISAADDNRDLAAAPEPATWESVNIPSNGEAGRWALASGSDVRKPVRAIDGTIYVYANPSDTGYTLFKSIDDGISWNSAGKVRDNIIDIAVASDNASVLYYATESAVYLSMDAGISFNQFPPQPGGAGSGNITIKDIDITRKDGKSTVAVAVADADAMQYGGVYYFDENKPFSGWTSASVGNHDTYAVLHGMR